MKLIGESSGRTVSLWYSRHSIWALRVATTSLLRSPTVTWTSPYTLLWSGRETKLASWKSIAIVLALSPVRFTGTAEQEWEARAAVRRGSFWKCSRDNENVCGVTCFSLINAHSACRGAKLRSEKSQRAKCG